MPGANMLYVGRHRHMTSLGYVSPYLLEILNSSVGFSSQVATGSLTAITGQTVSCSRTASGYCLGNDGLLHLLGANTVRVEPAGLLVEGAGTNLEPNSTTFGGTGWSLFNTTSSNPTVTLNTGDVTDPAGGNTATKVVFPAVSGTQVSGLFDTSGYTSSGSSGAAAIWARTASGTAQIDFNQNRTGHAETNLINITSTWQRFSVPLVTPAATTWFIQPQVNAATQGTLASQTVYFWNPQPENLPFSTSDIRTSGATATRDADIVTVANPLNPSNPGTWRVGITGIPLDTWANVFNAGGGLNQLWYLGPAGSANSAELRAGNSTQTLFQVQDNGGGLLSVTTTVLSGSTPVTVVSLDAAGALSTVPAGGAPSGAGTGVIVTQGATMGIGSRSGSFPFFGHMTDIYVNNT